MNRIMQAEVILTLTREQAEGLLALVERTRSALLWTEQEVKGVVPLLDQCAKQGVQP